MDKKATFSIWYYVSIFGLILLLETLFFSGYSAKEIDYSEFRNRLEENRIETVVLTKDYIYGTFMPDKPDAHHVRPDNLTPPVRHTPWYVNLDKLFDSFRQAREKAKELKELQFMVVRLDDRNLVDLLQAHGVNYRGRIESNFFKNFIENWILPIGLMFILWTFLMKKMGGGGIGGPLSIGKNKAKLYEDSSALNIHFSDVAGVDEAVEETKEIVDFLKNPQKYTRLGAKLPKGVLLVGPPGTGKTLLAKAVAGEAGVTFYSIAGSDFVEMFVGVGAARVRDLFQEARSKAPCIVFIDEIDAMGKSRSGPGSPVGGYDERENTLNQMLVEMDGFDGSIGVIIMAATNRPEVLDKALLRPGRFDRQILLDQPDRKGRLEIFRVHTRNIVLADDVDLETIAAETTGFVGADIANICNEAALLASRSGRDAVTMQDFQDAFERVVGGIERKSKRLNERDRQRVAWHEAGHAVVGWFTPGADPVQKVSIVPRGQGALGYTLQAPEDDRYLMSKSELLGRVKGLLGGRAAEEIRFKEVSTGASDDLEKASGLVRQMLTVYGMSEKYPNISLIDRSNQGFLGGMPQKAEHSDDMERDLDRELSEIISRCYEESRAILQEKKERFEALAERLLEKEKIDTRDIEEILGPRP